MERSDTLDCLSIYGLQEQVMTTNGVYPTEIYSCTKWEKNGNGVFEPKLNSTKYNGSRYVNVNTMSSIEKFKTFSHFR